jgi:hypothetical protein
MSDHRRRISMSLAFGSAILAVAACGTTGDPGRSFPVASIGPAMTVSPAVVQTRVALVSALAAHDLVLTDTQAPVRPVEAPLLTTAPRAVYQVILPKDPQKGYIVVYEFTDPSGAATAAAQEQAYLATGPARVQTPPGTVSIIRQVGSTIVFYAWLPDAATDPSAAGIQSALETLGVGFPVAS